jgi:hypothetical protein
MMLISVEGTRRIPRCGMEPPRLCACGVSIQLRISRQGLAPSTTINILQKYQHSTLTQLSNKTRRVFRLYSRYKMRTVLKGCFPIKRTFGALFVLTWKRSYHSTKIKNGLNIAHVSRVDFNSVHIVILLFFLPNNCSK